MQGDGLRERGGNGERGVSHIATVRLQLTKRFERLNALKYRAADITEEVFVVIEELCAYVKVPTAAAIRAARNRLIEYDNMPARAREEQPNEIRLLFEPGTLRQQLEEFSKGDINDLTEQPLPLRHWPELDAHLGHFIRFRLASSAYCEGRFSIASNAARTRPNSTTKTLSGFVRRRSNAEATEYPSIILFTDLDPSWDNTKSPPELKKRMTRRTVSRARSFDTDFERLAPQAKQALEPMKKIYLADFTASFAKKHAAALPAPEAAGNDSSADEAEEEEDDDDDDDDVALSFLSAAPVRLGGTSEKGAADVHSRTWKRNGKAVQYDEEFGERLPDDDPLANRKANFVWEDTDNGIVVMLSGPKPKPPENTSAAKAHGVPLRKLKFYTQMRVQDEFGEIYSFDLREDASSEMAVVYYDDHPEGDKILWYADLLGFYTTPDGMPYIEHGYLFDREEIAADKSCSKFLKSTEQGGMGKILDNEIVNCTSIYHTPAACVEGKLQIHQHRPGQDIPDSDIFWRRVVDLETGKEVPVVKLRKPRCV